eukprot:GILI01039552.1.p1 GENE.GILI01039552.1~~GILI01039552.1.p1  ORF type:complete len:227 (-),score=36.25 GILI01039552.1:121-801(-)
MTPCLVTEYMENEDLMRAIYRKDAVLFRAMLQIAEGLNFMHSLGIVHRDLRPGNLMFDSFKQCKIKYSGLSRTKHFSSFEEPEAEEEQRYMFRAPEQLDRESRFPITEKADVWAFGCLLIAIFSDKSPWPWPFDYSEKEIVDCLSKQQVPAIPGPKCPPAAFAALIARCLKLDPNERPSMLECYNFLKEELETNWSGYEKGSEYYREDSSSEEEGGRGEEEEEWQF